MNNQYKSTISRLCLLVAVALLAMASLTACSSDEAKIPLPSPTLTEGSKTVSSIVFNWEPVEGASQYAYELYDSLGEKITADVTNTTTVVATGLKPKSQYTLKVWAFSPIDCKYTTSSIATITATTNEQIPLVAPTSASASTVSGGVTITWPAVEHASGYKYSLSNGIAGTTSTNSVTLTGLEREHTPSRSLQPATMNFMPTPSLSPSPSSAPRPSCGARLAPTLPPTSRRATTSSRPTSWPTTTAPTPSRRPTA